MDKTINHENDTLLEKIENSITGQDEPMGDAHPSAPIWLVMGTYPIVLMIAMFVASIYFAYTYVNYDELPLKPSESSTVK